MAEGEERFAALYEGKLYKKPTSLSAYLSWSGWRSRYCVADARGFRYYERKGDAAARGALRFTRGCTVEPKREQVSGGLPLFGFELVDPNGRVMTFASRSKEDVDLWVKVLRHKIQRAASAMGPKSKPRASSGSSGSKMEPADELTDFESEGEDEDGSPPFAPLFGTPPPDMDALVEERIGAEASARLEGWRLARLEAGVRFFEREEPLAGNSTTDLSGMLARLGGALEMKAQTSIVAEPEHLLAALLDVSAARRAWDSQLVRGEVVEVVDAHSDVVRIRMKASSSLPGAEEKEVTFARYWCRAEDGTIMLHCGTKRKDGSSGLPFWYATIVPHSRCCLVTFGACVESLSWTEMLGTSPLETLLSGLVPLKALCDSPEPVLGNADLEGDRGLSSDPLRYPVAGAMRDAFEKGGLDGNDLVEVVRLARAVHANGKHLAPGTLAPAARAAAPVTSPASPAASPSPVSPSPVTPPTARAAKAEIASIEPNYEYGMPRNNYLLPMAISKDGVSAWWDSGTEEGYWQVRGPNYLEDRVKVPNEVSAMELVQLQWSFYDEPKRNIAIDKDELIQQQHAGRTDRPFMLAINFMVPSIGNWVCYFAPRRGVKDAKFDRMLDAFLNGDDTFRNGRFKIIPSVVEGSYLAKRGIGSTPAILGKKLLTEYYSGPNWFEICVDVGSSRVAGSLMSIVKSYAKTLVIDLAFLLESQSLDELPERLIGGARMHLPLMEAVDDLTPYCKSAEALAEAYAFPPRPEAAEPAEPAAGVVPASAEASPEATAETAVAACETAAKDAKAQLLDYTYESPANNYLVPKARSANQKSMWWDSGTEVGYWKLRGPNYLEDRVKVPSRVSAMELVQMQWSFYDEPKRHITADPEELVQQQHAGRADRPFLFVVNFMVPSIGNWVCYFARRRGVEDATFDRMFTAFLDGDDEYRRDRFKIIPSVVEGYFVARRAIGSKPAILGRKLDMDFYRGENCFEVCVDVGSSKVAEGLMGVVKSFAATLVIDLAFLFESKSPDELPERLLGGGRMHLPLMFQIPEAELRRDYIKEP